MRVGGTDRQAIRAVELVRLPALGGHELHRRHRHEALAVLDLQAGLVANQRQHRAVRGVAPQPDTAVEICRWHRDGPDAALRSQRTRGRCRRPRGPTDSATLGETLQSTATERRCCGYRARNARVPRRRSAVRNLGDALVGADPEAERVAVIPAVAQLSGLLRLSQKLRVAHLRPLEVLVPAQQVAHRRQQAALAVHVLERHGRVVPVAGFSVREGASFDDARVVVAPRGAFHAERLEDALAA